MPCEIAHEREACAGDADHDGNARADPLQHAGDAGRGFLLREFLGLAHHAQHGDAVAPAVEVEIHQPVGRCPIHRAVVGERRRRDYIEAARGFVDESHGRFPELCRQASFV
jgi:hypothetical protein